MSSAHYDAEERAIKYLAEFPFQVALATALSAERLIAAKWEAGLSKMVTRDHEVDQIEPRNMQWFRKLLSEFPLDAQPDAAAEQYIIDLLSEFPPDWALWIVRKVANWAVCWAWSMNGIEMMVLNARKSYASSP
jgi:hypothetical protein